MLGTILNILQIKNEIPDPVGFHSFGPFSFPIPKEISETLNLDELAPLTEIEILHYEIDNFSSKIKNNIRVLYTGNFEFSPLIEYSHRDVKVEYEIIKDSSEIRIKELPPDEAVSITFFNTTNGFKVNQILIGEQMITSTMQKLAHAKRSPSLWGIPIVTLIISILTFSALGYAFYTLKRQAEINSHLNKAYDRLGYQSCIPSLFENPVGNEKILDRKFNQLTEIEQSNTLKINGVSTYKKLKSQDKILFCLK